MQAREVVEVVTGATGEGEEEAGVAATASLEVSTLSAGHDSRICLTGKAHFQLVMAHAIV